MLAGKIIIQCLPPVQTEGLTVDDVADLTNNVRNEMNKTFIDISKDLPIGHEFARVTASLKNE